MKSHMQKKVLRKHKIIMSEDSDIKIFEKMVEKIIFENGLYNFEEVLEKIIFKSENWADLKKSINDLYDHKISIKTFNEQELKSRALIVKRLKEKITNYQKKSFEEIMQSIIFLINNVIKPKISNVDNDGLKDFILEVCQEIITIRNKLKAKKLKE